MNIFRYTIFVAKHFQHLRKIVNEIIIHSFIILWTTIVLNTYTKVWVKLHQLVSIMLMSIASWLAFSGNEGLQLLSLSAYYRINGETC